MARCKGFEPLTFWFVDTKLSFYGFLYFCTIPYISTISAVLHFISFHSFKRFCVPLVHKWYTKSVNQKPTKKY